MLRRGFSLANVIILSTLITLVGYAGLMLVNINLTSSRAENKYIWAEKAANAGLLEAMRRIKSTGFCDVNQTFTGSVGNATYEVNIKRSSRICFIRSEGKLGKAKVIKTGILQAYYGVGLYTVRGNVNANLGWGVRLSGCDNTVRPPCFVPAFIASGHVYSSYFPRACNYDYGGLGVYGGTTGREAIITYVKFSDLIPLFFNVNCFNKYSSPGCDVGLLQVFEEEYGKNPSNDRQDVLFDNKWGIPRVDFSDLPPTDACKTTGYSIGFPWNPIYIVDLSSPDLAGCTDINIDIPSPGRLRIEGIANNYLNIYVLDNDISRVEIDSKVSSEGFTLYSSKPVYIYRNLANARIITNNNIYFMGDRKIENSILIAAPININTTNNPNSNARIITDDWRRITFEKSKIIVRQIRFGDRARVYVLDSLIYVYAHACPACNRSSDTISWWKCAYENTGWCGWYGRFIRLSVGRDASGEERPSIILTNNTTVYTVYPQGTVYIWGAFVGEDITYLLWTGVWYQDFRGFLVRNFPPGSSLRINIWGGFSLEFSKSLLDKLSENFWYFRKIQCIKEDINPRAQLIHTRLTAY